jgi:hypothetical protein
MPGACRAQAKGPQTRARDSGLAGWPAATESFLEPTRDRRHAPLCGRTGHTEPCARSHCRGARLPTGPGVSSWSALFDFR